MDEEKELNIDELETVASEEIVEVEEEEQFEDADEGQAEEFIDDDDDDLAVVGSFELIPEDDTARGDPSPMDVEGDPLKREPKTKAKKPKKKAMPKPKMKVVDEGHGPAKQQFDTSAFASAQDVVWIEPDLKNRECCLSSLQGYGLILSTLN